MGRISRKFAFRQLPPRLCSAEEALHFLSPRLRHTRLRVIHDAPITVRRPRWYRRPSGRTHRRRRGYATQRLGLHERIARRSLLAVTGRGHGSLRPRTYEHRSAAPAEREAPLPLEARMRELRRTRARGRTRARARRHRAYLGPLHAAPSRPRCARRHMVATRWNTTTGGAERHHADTWLSGASRVPR